MKKKNEYEDDFESKYESSGDYTTELEDELAKEDIKEEDLFQSEPSSKYAQERAKGIRSAFETASEASKPKSFFRKPKEVQPERKPSIPDDSGKTPFPLAKIKGFGEGNFTEAAAGKINESKKPILTKEEMLQNRKNRAEEEYKQDLEDVADEVSIWKAGKAKSDTKEMQEINDKLEAEARAKFYRKYKERFQKQGSEKPMKKIGTPKLRRGRME